MSLALEPAAALPAAQDSSDDWSWLLVFDELVLFALATRVCIADRL